MLNQIDVRVTYHKGVLPKTIRMSFDGQLSEGRAHVRVVEPIGPQQDKISLSTVEAFIRVLLGPDVHVWKTPIKQEVSSFDHESGSYYEIRDVKEP
jgi:hypothetical protein